VLAPFILSTNFREVQILTSKTIPIDKRKIQIQKTIPMDHLHYRLNFDLDKNFITA
jgi:hypothetical protein